MMKIQERAAQVRLKCPECKKRVKRLYVINARGDLLCRTCAEAGIREAKA